MSLKNMKVRVKLLGGFAIVIVLTVVLGVIALSRVSSMNAQTKQFSERWLPQVMAMAKVNEHLIDVRGNLLKHVIATDQAVMDELKAKFEEAEAAVDEQMAAFVQMPVSAEGIAQAEELQAAWEAYHEFAPEVFALSDAGDKQAAGELINGEMGAQGAKVLELIAAVVDRQAQSSDATAAEAASTASSARTTILALLVLVVVLASAIGFLISNAIVRPLNKTVDVLKAMAEGDLTQRVNYEAKDEIGQMAEALDAALERTHVAVSTIANEAAALAAASEELSAAAHQVSASVDTVASASEEMGASAREISESAQQATQVAQQANELAHAAAGTVHELGEASQSIGSVVAAITEIAEQTNLLALNATIEGARAGEAGKGFAVVASEVKQLAQQTGTETEEIRSKVAGIQNSSGGVVEAIEQIANIIGTIDDSQSAIASAVEEQTVTTAEMARTITEAATGVRSISESIGADGGLLSMAAELDSLVKQFRI